MNFTKSPFEAMMKKPSHIQTPGIACVSCYRELLGKPGGR